MKAVMVSLTKIGFLPSPRFFQSACAIYIHTYTYMRYDMIIPGVHIHTYLLCICSVSYIHTYTQCSYVMLSRHNALRQTFENVDLIENPNFDVVSMLE